MQPLLHTRPFASRIFSGDPEPLALERVRVVDMVLQRGAPIRMNGKAAPGDLVTVKMDGATCTVTASTSDGTWACELPAKDASGEPAEVTVSSSSGESITLTDVLIGDVWIFQIPFSFRLELLQGANL